MADLDGGPGVPRPYLAITLGGLLAWTTYVSVTALSRVPAIFVIFSGYDSPMPGITLLLGLVYRWFWTVPVLGLLLAADALRRPRVSAGHAAALFTGLALLGAVMHFILYEGMFSPLWKLAKVFV